MHTNNYKECIFCGYQNKLIAIIYKNLLESVFSFFLFCFLPSIKNTNLDKILPKKGTQNFSYKKFIVY